MEKESRGRKKEKGNATTDKTKNCYS